MAIARPPKQPKKKKPRQKRPVPKKGVFMGVKPKAHTPRGVGTIAPPPTAPPVSSTPITPQTAPPPPPPPPARTPTPTVQGESTRQQAHESFGLTRAELARQLFNAAFRYVDSSLLGARVQRIEDKDLDLGDLSTTSLADIFGIDAPVVNDNSDLARIARSRVDQGKTLDENLNSGNTFFSGIRLRRQGELDDAATRDRDVARTAFIDAYNALVGELGRAISTRSGQLSEADLADIAAMEAEEPEAEVPEQPSDPAVGRGPYIEGTDIPLSTLPKTKDPFAGKKPKPKPKKKPKPKPKKKPKDKKKPKKKKGKN